MLLGLIWIIGVQPDSVGDGLFDHNGYAIVGRIFQYKCYVVIVYHVDRGLHHIDQGIFDRPGQAFIVAGIADVTNFPGVAVAFEHRQGIHFDQSIVAMGVQQHRIQLDGFQAAQGAVDGGHCDCEGAHTAVSEDFVMPAFADNTISSRRWARWRPIISSLLA